MEVLSSKIVALAFYFFALLYIWLKIRDKVHEKIDIAFDNVPLESEINQYDEDADERKLNKVFPLTNISGEPFNMLVRIIIIISLFTLFLYLFSSVVQWMWFTSPVNLAVSGTLYNAALDGTNVRQTTGPEVDTKEYVLAMLMTLFDNLKLIFTSILLTIIMLYMYSQFAISDYDWTSREAMHMHADNFLCIALFIQFYVIYIIFADFSKPIS